MNELEKRRRQILYRANHRGIKEMDIILGGYVTEHVGTLDPDQLDELERLMEESDRELLSWFTREKPVPEAMRGAIVDAIFDHCANQFN